MAQNLRAASGRRWTTAADAGGSGEGNRATAHRGAAHARAGDRPKKISRHTLRNARERYAQIEAMKGAHGLRGRKKHCRHPRTTDSHHAQPVAANLIAKRPSPTGPNQAWMTDITYLRTAEGWLFLAAILDVWSRRVVGWACGPTLHASLVLTALHDALKRRRPAKGLLHHSDRGSQYVDADYLAALAAAGIERSMSRAGNCYDNAAMESFWSTLKTDTGLDESIPASRRHAELAVFDYIETFYNPTRRHSSLGNISPVAFEKQQLLNDIKAA